MDNVNVNGAELFDKTVYDHDGDKVGSISNVYLDDETGKVKWVTVKTGLFGTQEAFVPFSAIHSRGDELSLPYEKAFIKDAPHMDADQHITPDEEEELYRYYRVGGLDNVATDETVESRENIQSTPVLDGAEDHREHAESVKADLAEEGLEHRDYAHTATETNGLADSTERHDEIADRDVNVERDLDGDREGLVLHEERVNVGTETVEAGEARIHKTVVTETQSVDVPVTHEEVHVVREPINETVDHDVKLGEEEVSVTLHEERPVVEKETVAVERVSLDTNQVTEHRTVEVEAAHEEVKVDRVETVDGDFEAREH